MMMLEKTKPINSYNMMMLEKTKPWKMNVKSKALEQLLNMQGQELHRELEGRPQISNPLWQNLRYVEWGWASGRNQKWNMGAECLSTTSLHSNI